VGYRAKRDRFPILSNPILSNRVISTGTAHSFIVRCVVERPPHFAFAFAVVFAVHLYLLFSCHPSPQAEDLPLAFAVVFAVHLLLLFSCHPSPQAEDLLLAFAVVVAGRIGI
jgi:predicted neutral ceramidase superfamily lipid hydrolase